MPRVTQLKEGIEKEIWQAHFRKHDYANIMKLRSAYNAGCSSRETRKAASMYVSFRRKVREVRALANA